MALGYESADWNQRSCVRGHGCFRHVFLLFRLESNSGLGRQFRLAHATRRAVAFGYSLVPSLEHLSPGNQHDMSMVDWQDGGEDLWSFCSCKHLLAHINRPGLFEGNLGPAGNERRSVRVYLGDR